VVCGMPVDKIHHRCVNGYNQEIRNLESDISNDKSN